MVTRQFHWSTLNDCVMQETDGTGNLLATYTHEPRPYGSLVSEHRDDEEYYHHYDALGSTTLLTDSTGTVTDTFRHDAWGNETAHTGTTNTPYRWVGKHGYHSDHHTTGGYYVRARTDQPTIARWTSVDLFWAFEKQGHYRYANNSPMMWLDASGLYGCCEKKKTSKCGPGITRS